MVVGILVRVIRSKKCPPVQKQATCKTAPADNAKSVCAVPILGPRFGKMFAAFFYMAEGGSGRSVCRAPLKPARTLVGVERPYLVERVANALQVHSMRGGKRIEVV